MHGFEKPDKTPKRSELKTRKQQKGVRQPSRKTRSVFQPIYKLPLILSPQPEGGYTVSCPMLPELITEGDTVAAAMDHVRDALSATLELYEDLGKPLPNSLLQTPQTDPVWFEALVTAL